MAGINYEKFLTDLIAPLVIYPNEVKVRYFLKKLNQSLYK